jgi:hypothetical protein
MKYALLVCYEAHANVFSPKVQAELTIDRVMTHCRANVRLMSLALVVMLALGANSTAQADNDTWHNVYHSLKRFFTGSKSSSTPSAHHHVRHSGGAKSVEPSPAKLSAPENMPDASPSPTESSTPRVVVLPAATPDVVVLPSATPVREASSAATPSGAAATTPTPEVRPAGQMGPKAANSTSKSESQADTGPVLRSLSRPATAGSPSSEPTVTP